MKTRFTILISLFLLSISFFSQAEKKHKLTNCGVVQYTPIDIPDVPDSLMNVSVYPTVKVKSSEIPVKMAGPEIDFVEKYKVPTNGQNVSALLQQAIDELAAQGGGKIFIRKGDYQLGGIALKSNIHLLFDKGTIIRPYSDDPSQVYVFDVSGSGLSDIVKNVSIQGVGGRAIVLLPKEVQGFDSRFAFIRSRYVQDFYYVNFTIYDHKTVLSCLTFGAADRNDQNFVGPTNGLVMNFTVVDAHYGYGLVQTQAGRNIRFYNLHGIGGITLRMETGSNKMNREQFGGVFDIEGRNISVANGHGGVLCGAHGMTNGVARVSDVTAFSSGTGYGIGDGIFKHDGKVYHGSFAKETSIKNVTAIFGFHAQIKTKELWRIPEEYLPLIGKPGRRAIIENAPAHTCVRISTSFPVEYDESTFVAKGFKYGNPILITKGKIQDEEKQKRFSEYIMKKYRLKTLNSKNM